jgi:hypothetical protein
MCIGAAGPAHRGFVAETAASIAASQPASTTTSITTKGCRNDGNASDARGRAAVIRSPTSSAAESPRATSCRCSGSTVGRRPVIRRVSMVYGADRADAAHVFTTTACALVRRRSLRCVRIIPAADRASRWAESQLNCIRRAGCRSFAGRPGNTEVSPPLVGCDRRDDAVLGGCVACVPRERADPRGCRVGIGCLRRPPGSGCSGQPSSGPPAQKGAGCESPPITGCRRPHRRRGPWPVRDNRSSLRLAIETMWTDRPRILQRCRRCSCDHAPCSRLWHF